VKTTKDLAHEIGCHLRTVQGWCKRLGIAREGRDYLLDYDDATAVKLLVQDGPGRPTRGYYENR
jgi:hypothetical protein